MKNSNDTQISLTDKDSRALMLTNNVSGVEYAVQAAFDSKHKLLVHSHLEHQLIKENYQQRH